jgi:hypothetical protein
MRNKVGMNEIKEEEEVQNEDTVNYFEEQKQKEDEKMP